MKSTLTGKIIIAVGALLLCLLFQPAAHADGVTFTVTTNTSSFAGSTAYEVGFTLQDASGTGDGNNTATITDFGYGGGSPGATDPLSTTGGTTGDLAGGTVTLTDNQTAYPNITSFASEFTAGSQLSFTVTLTTNPDATVDASLGIPGDQFAFYLLNASNGVPISTTNSCGEDDTGICALVIATIEPNGTVSLQSFSSDLTGHVRVTTPEPATLLLLGTGIAGLGLLKKKRAA